MYSFKIYIGLSRTVMPCSVRARVCGCRGPDVNFLFLAFTTYRIVINTCGFVEEAKNESLEAIMQAIQKKNEGKTKRVVITV